MFGEKKAILMYNVCGFVDALSKHGEMFLVFKMRKHLKSLSVLLPERFPRPIRERYANWPAVKSQAPQSQNNSTGFRQADLNQI